MSGALRVGRPGGDRFVDSRRAVARGPGTCPVAVEPTHWWGSFGDGWRGAMSDRRSYMTDWARWLGEEADLGDDWMQMVVGRSQTGEAVSSPETEGRAERWAPVAEAGRELAADLLELGRYVAAADPEKADLEALLERSNRRFAEVVASFPEISAVHEDACRLDEWLERRLREPADHSPIWTCLAWVESVVDALIRRAVDRVFAEEEKRVAPDRARAFLERLDEVTRMLVERWIESVEGGGGGSGSGTGGAGSASGGRGGRGKP